MELEGEYIIVAERQQVWDALNNADVLKQCIPGCEEIEKTSDTSFTASVVTKVGPVKAKFSGEVELTNLIPPTSYTISGEGKGGAAGFASGSAQVTLTETEDGQTNLSYNVNAQVGGKLAQIGSRLIDSTAKKLAREFFDKFAKIVDPSESQPSVSEDVEVTSIEKNMENIMENEKNTEENIYPNTHWTLWLLGIISVAALVTFAANLQFS